MSEFGPSMEVSEEPTPPTLQEKLHRIYQTMQENNIYTVRAFYKNKTFELAWADNPETAGKEQVLEDEFLQFFEKDPNGYIVLEGAHPEHQSIIFKMKLEGSPDARRTGHNEEYFYEDLAPEITNNMPEDIDHVKLPELYASGHTDEGSYVVTEMAEGEQIGSITKAEKPLSPDEFRQICGFIRFFQTFMTPERVKSLSPRLEINSDIDASTFEAHQKRFNDQKAMFAKHLGEDYATRAEQLLKENETLLRESQVVFTNQDIIPSNVIKSGQDLCIFDWERLKLVPNSAAAYSHMIEAHWQWPEKQNEMIKEAIELNKDIPDFKRLLRLDMIFFKYSIGSYWWMEDSNRSDEKRKEASECATYLTAFLKDAIDGTGIWAGEESSS